MIIKEQDFIIEKLDDLSFYNLSFSTVVNKGKEDERTEYKVVSYGIPFHTCIEMIVDYRMKNVEKELSLKEYVEKYKEEVNKIGELFE